VLIPLQLAPRQFFWSQLRCSVQILFAASGLGFRDLGLGFRLKISSSFFQSLLHISHIVSPCVHWSELGSYISRVEC
jgi:hypothetical protein